MTPSQAEEQLILLQEDQGDPEANHLAADNILCDLLIALGCPKVVAAWRDLEKWYA